MATILAADTATHLNTAAVCRADESGFEVLAETVVACRRMHSERLMATLDWVLSEAALSLEDIDILAVSAGPGSFTGLRVGVSTFKGLAFAKRLPLVAVPTLDAMAAAFPAVSPYPVASGRELVVCPLLDARMKEVYGAAYQGGGTARRKVVRDCVCPIEQFAARLSEETDGAAPVFLGEGASLYRDQIYTLLPDASVLLAPHMPPRAAAVAAEAAARMQAGTPSDAALVSPVYLRKSQAEVNRDARAAEANV